MYVTNFNYVYDTAGNNWDRWDGKVSIGNTLPVPVSVVGGRVSIQGTVSISPQTINVNVCNAIPAAGATQLVSVGGTVSTQGVQIVGRDINGDARTPRMHTDGSLIVHISAGTAGGVGGSTQLVSVAGPVSTQAVQVAYTDGTNARTPLTDTTGRIVISSIADDVSIAPQTFITHVSNIAHVSVMDKVSIAGLVGLNAGTNLVGAVSVRQIVSVVPDGTGPNFPVSIAPLTFNVPVSLAAGRVSVQGIADVSVQDNAPVSVRGGVLEQFHLVEAQHILDVFLYL